MNAPMFSAGSEGNLIVKMLFKCPLFSASIAPAALINWHRVVLGTKLFMTVILADTFAGSVA